MNAPQYMRATTTHVRRGMIRNAFTYGVDMVLVDPEAPAKGPALFSRNRFNLMAVHDRDHGGPMGQGRGAAWLRNVLKTHGFDDPALRLRLLTQPRFLGYGFNPASFWLVFSGADLVAYVAEVSTPFGDRHSYLCYAPDHAAISADTKITAPKALHVSPFQEVKGSYDFRIHQSPDRLAIRISHKNGPHGVIATLTGPVMPLKDRHILWAAIRRPFGALRVMVLIHTQALRLKLKGARYRTRPTPPTHEVT